MSDGTGSPVGALERGKRMDLHAWGAQRARYSRARHGRKERGAALVECALIQAAAQAIGVRQMRLTGQAPVVVRDAVSEDPAAA